MSEQENRALKDVSLKELIERRDEMAKVLPPAQREYVAIKEEIGRRTAAIKKMDPKDIDEALANAGVASEAPED